MQKLIDPDYLTFPFRVDAQSVNTSKRKEHIRQQIEQVLFTDPRERIFRPHFGAGVRTLVFEPNASALWRMAQERLSASLVEALQGEVDPKTLDIQVKGDEETLWLDITYQLATINQTERHSIPITGGGSHG